MTTEPIRAGDLVLFRQNADTVLAGTVTGVWNKPAADPYLTLRTVERPPRTFVRCTSDCTPVSLQDLHDACDLVAKFAGDGAGAERAGQLAEWTRGAAHLRADEDRRGAQS